MRDRDLPAMRDYLAAERAYYDQQLDGGLCEELAGELIARVAPAEDSVSWRRDGHTYFTRTVPGQEFEQFCRAGSGGADALLDVNLLLDDPACTGGYVELGVREVSPDGRLLAYSVDFDGSEIYQLRVRDLVSGTDLADRIDGTYYELAWAADSQSFFYIVPDARYRPHEVWRHGWATPDRPGRPGLRRSRRAFRPDRAVHPQRGVRADRVGIAGHHGDAHHPGGRRQRGGSRPGTEKAGVEYRADHGDGPDGGEFYLVTNDQASEFRLVRAPARAPGSAAWTEVIAGSPDTRLVSADVFGRYLVVEQRHGAATQLRILDRRTGEQRLIEAGGPQVSLALATNEDYAAPAVTVCTQSLIDPAWHDVDLASGRWELRKRQDVPGYDPARYVTERIAAPAADGTQVPVTIAHRHGARPDGTAPCLLYGYGAYEACDWPEFSVATPSLLDRGFVYAMAHVRGGGEGGRGWWLDGRLDRKRNTFTDFIAAADMLADRGWAAPGPDRFARAFRGRPAAGRGVLDGAAALAGGGGRGPVRGLRDHHAGPGHPAHHQRVGRVGRARAIPASAPTWSPTAPTTTCPRGPRPNLLVTGEPARPQGADP